jgi:hypothetical protein
MRRANAGQATGNDLAAFGNEGRKETDVLVVDAVDLIGAELADLLAPEEFASTFAAAGRASTAATLARSTLWAGRTLRC